MWTAMNTSPLILCLSLAHTQTAHSTQTYSFHIPLLWQCKCCRWDNLLRKPLIEIVVYHWIYARDYLSFYSHHFDSSYTLPATVLLGQFYLVLQISDFILIYMPIVPCRYVWSGKDLLLAGAWLLPCCATSATLTQAQQHYRTTYTISDDRPPSLL